MIWQLQRQCSAVLGRRQRPGLRSRLFIGELGLDGCVKPVKGVLPRVFAAAGQDMAYVCSFRKQAEGTAVKDIEIIGVNSLKRVPWNILSGRIEAAGHWVLMRAMFRKRTDFLIR